MIRVHSLRALAPTEHFQFLRKVLLMHRRRSAVTATSDSFVFPSGAIRRKNRTLAGKFLWLARALEAKKSREPAGIPHAVICAQSLAASTEQVKPGVTSHPSTHHLPKSVKDWCHSPQALPIGPGV
jgi:hypothetical protein